jgi:uncharacterized membrane protein YhaH (DUF805 family)
MSLGHLLFSFQGRLNRAKVWLFSLAAFVAWSVFVVVAISLVAAGQASTTGPSAEGNVHLQKVLDSALLPVLLTCVFAALAFYCGMAVFAKRLHDRGKTAWWLMVFILGPALIDLLGGVMSMQDTDVGTDLGGVCVLAATGVYLWGLVEFYLLPGAQGDNRYGPDPLHHTA